MYTIYSSEEAEPPLHPLKKVDLTLDEKIPTFFLFFFTPYCVCPDRSRDPWGATVPADSLQDRPDTEGCRVPPGPQPQTAGWWTLPALSDDRAQVSHPSTLPRIYERQILIFPDPHIPTFRKSYNSHRCFLVKVIKTICLLSVNLNKCSVFFLQSEDRRQVKNLVITSNLLSFSV